MAWARIEFLTPQAKISCPRGFATWARIFAFGVRILFLPAPLVENPIFCIQIMKYYLTLLNSEFNIILTSENNL